MTYIELLNNFWDSTRFNPCSSNEAMIYLYLLHQCNIRRWANPFELNTKGLESALGISRTTVIAVRDKLRKRGFIDFIKGEGSGKSIYRLNRVKISDSVLNDKFCVQSVDAKLDTKLDTNVNSTPGEEICVQNNDQKLDTKVDTNADPTLLIEDIKTKDISVADATRDAHARTEPRSLFAEEEKNAAKTKSPPKPKITFEPPTLDEVKRYFLSQDADKRLENWEESARRFYDNYTAVDWYDKFNRRITRWDSRANSWIIDDEKREKERKQNEQSRTDRPLSPSGGIPIRGKVTPSCGLKRRDPPGET